MGGAWERRGLVSRGWDFFGDGGGEVFGRCYFQKIHSRGAFGDGGMMDEKREVSQPFVARVGDR